MPIQTGIDQHNIILTINQYLRIRGRDEFADNLSPGYCYGLSLLFCYYASIQQLNQFYALLSAVGNRDSSEDSDLENKILFVKKSDAWKKATNKLEVIIDSMPPPKVTEFKDKVNYAIKKSLLSPEENTLLMSVFFPDDINIEKLLSRMEWLQRADKYAPINLGYQRINFLTDEVNKSIATALPFNLKPEFLTTMNIDKDKLPELFENLPINRCIIIGIGRHAVTCYGTSSGWSYYDSIFDREKPVVKTARDVTEMFDTTFKLLGGIGGTHLPVRLDITSQGNQPAFNYSKLEKFCDQYMNTDNINNVKSIHPSNYPFDKISPLSLAISTNSLALINKILDDKNNLMIADAIGIHSIHYVALYGERDIMQAFLKHQVSVDQQLESCDANSLSADAQSLHTSIKGVTPLYFAAFKGDIEMAEFLLANGANINAASNTGMTPLAIACFNNNVKMIDYLLSKNADFNKTINVTNKTRNKLQPKISKEITPLEAMAGAIDLSPVVNGMNLAMLSALRGHNATVMKLLAKGIDVNAHAEDGTTLLHIAVKNGNLTLVKDLLNKKIDINSLCKISTNPEVYSDALQLACELKNKEIIDLLLNNGAKPKSKLSNQKPCIVAAIENNDEDLFAHLLAHGADKLELSQTQVPLDRAASKLYLKLKDFKDMKAESRAHAESLLKMILDNEHTPPFHFLLIHAIAHSDADFSKLLILNQKAVLNPSIPPLPLNQALAQNDKKTLRWLLMSGANFFKKATYNDLISESPLHFAVAYRVELFIHCMDYLCILDPTNIDKIDEEGRAAIHYAASTLNHSLLQYLLKKGANIYLKDKNNKTALEILLQGSFDAANRQIAVRLILSKIDLNLMDVTQKINLLHLLCEHEHTKNYHSEIFKKVNKKDLNLLNDNGHAPLHTAIKNYNIFAIMNLLEAGANVNQMTAAGNTPLAVIFLVISDPVEKFNYVQLLLKHGADVNCKVGKDNKTVLDLVNQSDDKKLRSLFSDKKALTARPPH